jgi:hypothetical protein
MKAENNYIYPTYGGYNGINTFLEKLENEQYFPYECFHDNIEGMMTVQFTVEPDKGITHVTIKKGLHKKLDEVVQEMILWCHNWTSGKLNGKEVPVTVEMDMQFEILNK